MFAKRLGLAARTVLVCLLTPTLLVGTPPTARAETSYHKLKHRLRKLEKNTGKAIGTTAAITGEVTAAAFLIGLAAVLHIEDDDDDQPSLIEIVFEQVTGKTGGQKAGGSAGSNHLGGGAKSAPAKKEHSK
jgi:hypothetical protein